MVRDGLELWLPPSGVILSVQCISAEYMTSAVDHGTKTTLWTQLRREKPKGVEEEETQEAAPSGGNPLPKREGLTTEEAQAAKKPKAPAKAPEGLPPKPTRPVPIPEEEEEEEEQKPKQPQVQMTRHSLL